MKRVLCFHRVNWGSFFKARTSPTAPFILLIFVLFSNCGPVPTPQRKKQRHNKGYLQNSSSVLHARMHKHKTKKNAFIKKKKKKHYSNEKKQNQPGKEARNAHTYTRTHTYQNILGIGTPVPFFLFLFLTHDIPMPQTTRHFFSVGAFGKDRRKTHCQFVRTKRDTKGGKKRCEYVQLHMIHSHDRSAALAATVHRINGSSPGVNG